MHAGQITYLVFFAIASAWLFLTLEAPSAIARNDASASDLRPSDRCGAEAGRAVVRTPKCH